MQRSLLHLAQLKSTLMLQQHLGLNLIVDLFFLRVNFYHKEKGEYLIKQKTYKRSPSHYDLKFKRWRKSRKEATSIWPNQSYDDIKKWRLYFSPTSLNPIKSPSIPFSSNGPHKTAQRILLSIFLTHIGQLLEFSKIESIQNSRYSIFEIPQQRVQL